MKATKIKTADTEALAPRAALAGGPLPSMADYLPRLVARLGFPADPRRRHLMLAHLFDDTMRMLSALEPMVGWDAIIGVPYSSNRPGVAARWSARFGDRVLIPRDLGALEGVLVDQLARSLAECRRNGQTLIVQEVGGFVAPLLHRYFADQAHLVQGVVEITKQGVWRARDLPLAFPVLHCADSELKRLEAQRCGETVARCLDGAARSMGLSLAGREALVIGAGWIGAGVARGLARLDMAPRLVDRDPLKVMEARLNGLPADLAPRDPGRAALVVGATGAASIGPDLMAALPDGAILASASSRQIEIDVAWLRDHPSAHVAEGVEAFALRDGRRLMLVNDGFPANFLPGSGSVADEIVETILGELIVLMRDLSARDFPPGVHRIAPEQEALCAALWLELRDANLRSPA